MEELFKETITYIVNGGSGAITTILLCIIVALLYERKIMNKNLDELVERAISFKDDEIRYIREIIDNYHQGNLNLVQALNEIKIVLVALQNSKR